MIKFNVEGIFYLNNAQNIAVIGASNNQSKFGYKITQALKERFNVYPINPKENKILDLNCYKSILDIPENIKIDIASIVVPPNISYSVLDGLAQRGVDLVWFQPGSYDSKVINKANDLKINFLVNQCILTESQKL
ncbi:MAG: CoA-binding protein [Candidatus Dojkabacteria bacterium]|nr:MAG: CoA-binding protein [Candidatus Dojkabacteria bacterium]